MNEEPKMESELIRFQTSYIELLHRTSIEIGRLKLLTHVLICVHQKKAPSSNINHKLNTNERLLHALNNGNNIEPNLELNIYHEAQQNSTMDIESHKQQIDILRDSKLTLIKSSSFEIDRLRKIMKYLAHKISNTDTAPSPINCISRKTAPTYSWDEISRHNTENDLWLVYADKIYDITRFLRFHPGGIGVILEIAAKNQDITQALQELNHPPVTDRIMVKHFIGNVGAGKDSKKQRFSWIKPIWDADKGFVDGDMDGDNKRGSVSWLKPIWNGIVGDLTVNLVDGNEGLCSDNNAIIKYDDCYCVKIDILDKQHENLINIINNLYNRYELKDVMELLHRWDVHCKTEETLFFYYQFNEKDKREHMAHHKKLYHKIKDQITDLRIKYNNEKLRCEELINFGKYFSKLFKNHHVLYDSKYIDHLT